eukprot:bmy_14605T0
MITASHNCKEENRQRITSPHDEESPKRIEDCVEPWNASWNNDLVNASLLERDSLQDITGDTWKTTLTFVHISFHGVGHDYVQLALQVFGFKPPIPLPEQKDPDPDFSTIKCPNMKENLLAEKENARIVLSTDPNADQLAVAELQEDGQWKVFTGNELATLFVLNKDGVCEKYDYHISKTSYFLCFDLTTNKCIFESLHNFDSPKEHPSYCIHGTLPVNMTAASLIRSQCWGFLGGA